MLNESALESGQWRNVPTVGKDPSEIRETSSLYNNTLFRDINI